MKQTFLGILILTVASLMLSCDKVEMPVEPQIVVIDSNAIYPDVDSANLHQTRKVMVEEFTGHKCTACPANTDELLKQQNANGEEIIVVSYHAGVFAPIELPDYPTDFQTEYGNEIHDYFPDIRNGYPCALVNRVRFEDFDNAIVFQTIAKWTAPINASVGAASSIGLGVAADYSESEGQFYISVAGQAEEDLLGDYRLVVLCLEDSVIAEQKDGRLNEDDFPGKINPNYAHRHVLRDQVNASAGVFGEVVIEGGLLSGEWFGKTYSYTPSENVVTKEKCTIVAFVIEVSTEEIVQVEEVHVHKVD